MAASPLRMVKALLKRDDAPALQQQIGALKTEAAEACAEIERLQGERALCDDYEAACAVDERIKRQKWVVAHADAVLPKLELRRSALRQLEQAAALTRHKGILCAIYPRLKAAITEAGRVQQEAMDARTAAIAELGEGLVQRELPAVAFAGFITPDLIRLWESQNDRVVEASQRKPRPAPPAPPPAKPKAAAPKPVITPPAPKRTRPPRRDPPPEDPDQVAIVMLRNGVELADGSQSVTGDTLTMLADQARQLVLQGAADYLQKEAGRG